VMRRRAAGVFLAAFSTSFWWLFPLPRLALFFCGFGYLLILFDQRVFFKLKSGCPEDSESRELSFFRVFLVFGGLGDPPRRGLAVISRIGSC